MEETMFIDPQRCIGCRACGRRLPRMRDAQSYSMIFVN